MVVTGRGASVQSFIAVSEAIGTGFGLLLVSAIPAAFISWGCRKGNVTGPEAIAFPVIAGGIAQIIMTGLVYLGASSDLAASVEAINENLPQMADKYTRIDNIKLCPETNNVAFKITMINVSSKRNIDVSQFSTDAKRILKRNICGSKSPVNEILHSGANIIYTLHSIDGYKLTSISRP